MSPSAMSEPSREWAQYQRTAIAEMMPWIPTTDISAVSISAPDRANGSPKAGDMIARNPKNHADKWLVAAEYFSDNFAEIAAKPERERVIGSNAAIENCARLVDLHAQEMRNNDLTLKPEGLTAIASAIRALKGDPASTVAHLPNVVVTKQEW